MSNSQISAPSNGVSDKVLEIETTLQQTAKYLKELYAECEILRNELLNYKTQYISLKEKCEGKCCAAGEMLKKEIDSKNNILQQIASSLSILHETKNFNIITNIYKIICSDGSDPLPQNVCISPKKEKLSQDESVSEIEGTPTGRTSPIIQSKKLRGSSNNLSLNNKRKCPESWKSPEKSNLMINFSSPNSSKTRGRMKQSKLNIVKVKASSVVDLTCSPELRVHPTGKRIEVNIKKEIADIDETIMPSPTSRLVNVPDIQKISSHDSPRKFKQPTTPLKFKIEEETRCDRLVKHSPTYTEHSIDLMEHCRKVHSKQIKTEKCNEENAEMDADESMSLLEKNRKSPLSPKKKPMSENINVTNVAEPVIESSMSILRQDYNKISPVNDKCKRTAPEPVYKEPVIRKKAEKRALRGWSCDECKTFYGELYKDDPEMLAIKMDECSKHRGKNNPIRPKTPPGFWNPRWDVPTDTEEFNRRNNAM
ncbi:uncharacterized protein LOC126972805 [Leptidea sinapis]|uniref:uncharacterized protein LOC126972805 n=1 Tax=Leptidea sinapis TaxID=189913 RepID=UPI0021376B8C|nr:uncharacterized protein LOC126972805 [Leptidea sinapis]